MACYDWIAIGGGFTGSVLSYELARKGFKVLLLEKDTIPDNATRYSYGGLAYWSGTTARSRQICQAGIEIHRQLSAELEADTEFREMDLVLTIDTDDDPEALLTAYAPFAIPPDLLTVPEAIALEPLLNPAAIAGVLRLPHGHIHPQKTNDAYQQAFCRSGGEIRYEHAIAFLEKGGRIEGIKTPQSNTFYAENIVVCAGGLSHSLLKQIGISVPLYFTRAQAIIMPPVELRLRTLVMPARQKRFALEASAIQEWEQLQSDAVGEVLDLGAVQFLDGSFCLGQISQLATDPEAKMDAIASETKIRTGISRLLPSLANLPGTCHSCLVAFSRPDRPLVGKLARSNNLYLFSGFTSTLVVAPPLAKDFANWITGQPPVLLDRPLVD